jgi:hypothetical protein
VHESTTDPATHEVVPVDAQAPTPHELATETYSSSVAPSQSSSTPLQVASLAAGVPAVQESTTDPAMHAVVPVDAHAPTPHEVAVET